MATIQLYNNGMTGGKPGMNDNAKLNDPAYFMDKLNRTGEIPKLAKRGKTQGWSPAVSRRMTQWLYSVGIPTLTGSGYSFTLTIKDCPPSAKHWSKIIDSLSKRFKRMSAVRYHWLTEWQARGVPHLHGCIYFDREIPRQKIKHAWVECAKAYFPNYKSQDVKPIYDDVGWFKYLSKHAVRGVQHYQRNSDNIPEQWKGYTGRMWGKGGDWGVEQPVKLEVDDFTFFRYRRTVRAWRKSKARNEYQEALAYLMRTGESTKYRQSKRNIIRARQLLKSSDPKVSMVRGINEFFEFEDNLRIFAYLQTLPYAEIYEV